MDKSVEVEKVVEDVKPIIPQVTTEVKKIESVENVEEAKYKIIGKAFLDSNKNGQKDKNEKMVGDVVVKLYDADSQKLIEQVVTNSIGEYIFDNVSVGEYYLKFEYDNQKYQLTDYKKKGVDLDKNSDAIMSNNSIITDKIKITLSKNPQTDDAVNEYNDYIRNQVLGTSLTLADNVENGTELNFDDFSLYVSVVKE